MHFYINFDSARSIQQSRLEEAERQRTSRRARRIRGRGAVPEPAPARPTLVPLPDDGGSQEPWLDADHERLRESA